MPIWSFALLGVKISPGWHIIKGSYQFGPQSQASG
jgi:hypothetical protein